MKNLLLGSLVVLALFVLTIPALAQTQAPVAAQGGFGYGPGNSSGVGAQMVGGRGMGWRQAGPGTCPMGYGPGWRAQRGYRQTQNWSNCPAWGGRGYGRGGGWGRRW